MGSVLSSFGALQGNIWSVAPFIPVGKGSKSEKWAFLPFFAPKWPKMALHDPK